MTIESNFKVYPCKIGRFSRTDRLFRLLNFIFDRCLFIRYNKSKIKDTVNLVSLLIFVLFGTHLLACIWCFLGRADLYLPDNERKSWVFAYDFDPNLIGELYIHSVYWVL